MLFMGMILLNACGEQVVSTKAVLPSPTPIINKSQPTALGVQPTQPSMQTDREISFTKDILPIFQEFAGGCHGTSGGLSLETYEGVMKVIVPGQPENSKLWKRLNGIGGPTMPPSGKLNEDLLQMIYLWIKQGAKNN